MTDTEEDQIREQFAICGEIENVRIVRDKKFRLGKGFGYVLFKVVSFTSENLALFTTGSLKNCQTCELSNSDTCNNKMATVYLIVTSKHVKISGVIYL